MPSGPTASALQAHRTPAESPEQRFSHLEELLTAFDQAPESPQPAPPLRRPRDPPAVRTADARRWLSDAVAGAAPQPHPEAQAGHKRAIRFRIRANSFRRTATSAIWKRTYLECLTTLAPILISFSRSVVSVQPRIGFGSAS